MAITKIKDSDYSNKGIRVKNNPLGLSVSEAQRAFDELSLDVIIPAVNRMASEIDTTVSELQNKDTTNSTAIAKNTADISTNKSDISKNKTDISQNKTDITELKERVSTTETDISTNKSDISKNKTDISQNKTDITDIKGKVSALQIDISQKAEKDNVLSKDNTEIFVPTENYNPATKKYVDDLVSTSGGGDMLKAVYDKQNKGLDIYEYADKHIDNKNNPHGVTAEQIGALTDTTLTKETILNKINVLDIAHGGTGANTVQKVNDKFGWCNPNLLINGDFQVWQRGTEFSQREDTIKYTADRWVIGFVNDGKTHTVKKHTDGTLYIDPNGGYTELRQVIETPDSIRGKNVTLQVCAKGGRTDGTKTNLRYGHGTYKNGTWSEVTLVEDKTWSNDEYEINTQIFTVPNNGNIYIDFFMYRENQVYIKWVKLEVGETATPFVPRGYAEELALCQRYFYKLNLLPTDAPSLGNGMMRTTTICHTTVYLPTALRINTPTVATTGTWQALIDGSNIEISTIAKHQCTGTEMVLAHTLKTASTIGKNVFVQGLNNSGADLTLDAEFY